MQNLEELKGVIENNTSYRFNILDWETPEQIYGSYNQLVSRKQDETEQEREYWESSPKYVHIHLMLEFPDLYEVINGRTQRKVIRSTRVITIVETNITKEELIQKNWDFFKEEFKQQTLKFLLTMNQSKSKQDLITDKIKPS